MRASQPSDRFFGLGRRSGPIAFNARFARLRPSKAWSTNDSDQPIAVARSISALGTDLPPEVQTGRPSAAWCPKRKVEIGRDRRPSSDCCLSSVARDVTLTGAKRSSDLAVVRRYRSRLSKVRRPFAAPASRAVIPLTECRWSRSLGLGLPTACDRDHRYVHYLDGAACRQARQSGFCACLGHAGLDGCVHHVGPCMSIRHLVYLVVALLAQAVPCCSVSAEVDVSAVYRELVDESTRICKEHEDSLYRKDSAYAQKAYSYASVMEGTDKRRWLRLNQGFRLREDDYYFSHLGFRSHGEGELKTLVFDSPLPRAYMCAHGVLYIASSFFDPESPLHLTDDELEALIAHEFVHFRDGHVLMQRAAAKFRDAGDTSGRKRGPLEPLTGDFDIQALFADEGREYEADRGALEILAAEKVPTAAYFSLLAKLVKAAPARSSGAALLVQRQTCISTYERAPQRFFWMAPEARAKIEAEGLVLMDRRRDEGRFFLRHGNLLAKVFADQTLPKGPPPRGAELIALAPLDLHAICAMAQQITNVQDARAKPLAKALSTSVLTWLSGTGKETLNEIL